MINQVETITPAVARELLTSNTSNRPLNARHVRFLASQMSAGQWMPTPVPICVALNGRVLDGQHRLSAIVESDCTQILYVARNCDPELFKVIDTGRTRRAADVLAIEGVVNVNNVVSLIRLLLADAHILANSTVLKKKMLTNADILTFYRDNDLAPYVEIAHKLYGQNRLLRWQEYAYAYYKLQSIDEKQATDFLTRLATGASLVEGSPLLLLRQKLEKAREARQNVDGYERMAWVFKAWNFTRKEENPTMIRWLFNEEYPKPI